MVDLRMVLATDCPKIEAGKIMDLCGVYKLCRDRRWDLRGSSRSAYGLPCVPDAEPGTTAGPSAHELENEPNQHEQHSGIDGVKAATHVPPARVELPVMGDPLITIGNELHKIGRIVPVARSRSRLCCA
jgi:hypothetical protein